MLMGGMTTSVQLVSERKSRVKAVKTKETLVATCSTWWDSSALARSTERLDGAPGDVQAGEGGTGVRIHCAAQHIFIS